MRFPLPGIVFVGRVFNPPRGQSGLTSPRRDTKITAATGRGRGRVVPEQRGTRTGGGRPAPRGGRMALRFTVLASGSAGNASLVESDGFGLLLDAGLGPRQLAARLAAAGSSWQA